MTWLRRSALGVVVLLVAIQFIPYNVQDPTARDEPKWDSPRTRSLFMTSCGNCHSNQTHVLWFEHVAPIRWYITNHVEDGRRALNVDEWHTSSGNVHDIIRVVRDGSMPPSYYTYFGLHSDSKLTAAQNRELVDGMIATAAADPPVHGQRR
jgi:mono/diheme cytochrome c family protein